jgi:preprotein translocase subunit SecD
LALTAANLHVAPNGYTGAISPSDTDSQFAAYSSTSPKYDKPSETVLLPGTSSSSHTRYVLGPAGLTGSAIRSASAQRVAGQWVVNVDLNGNGAAQWDNLSRQQFHAFIGIDLDGKVVSAAIIQPTQASFSSFRGQMQIAGGLNRHQAEALAARL